MCFDRKRSLYGVYRVKDKFMPQLRNASLEVQRKHKAKLRNEEEMSSLCTHVTYVDVDELEIDWDRRGSVAEAMIKRDSIEPVRKKRRN